MQRKQYRIAELKQEIETEVESLNASLQRHYQFRNSEAINRVAVLSLLLGAGAMSTGFFGMRRAIPARAFADRRRARRSA